MNKTELETLRDEIKELKERYEYKLQERTEERSISMKFGHLLTANEADRMIHVYVNIIQDLEEILK